MELIRQAAITNDPEFDWENLSVPTSFRAAILTRTFQQEIVRDRSDSMLPSEAVTITNVATPEVGHDEVLVAVMASAINFNTVWSALADPVSTFSFIDRFSRLSPSKAKHRQDFHVVGSDASGIVVKVGQGVTHWHPGDRVVVHCLNVELESHEGHDDAMLDPEQRIWGYETNFGGLAELTLVKANQLLTKPAHLTWEESASCGLVNSTAYRQLVSHNGAAMKQGDLILIWGAAGGLGSFATQYALNGGGIPICVVSSPEKAQLCRDMGASLIIDRSEEKYKFWSEDGSQNPAEWHRLAQKIRKLSGGRLPDIVFEHPGRETFGASVYVAKRGGVIVTCASTTGYMHEYDNRYLWMSLKKIIGSHFANYKEAYEANRLVSEGIIFPTLSTTYPLEKVGVALDSVHANEHTGKVSVLTLSPEPGLGITDKEKRDALFAQLSRFSKQI